MLPHPCKPMSMTVCTISLIFSALFTLTTFSSTPIPSKNMSLTSAKYSHASVSIDYPASWRNVSSIHLQFPFLALSYHLQAFLWILIASPPSSSGPYLKKLMIFRSSLALRTFPADSSTDFHALYPSLRFCFVKANGSTGPIRPNPHSTNSNVASPQLLSLNIAILIYRFSTYRYLGICDI